MALAVLQVFRLYVLALGLVARHNSCRESDIQHNVSLLRPQVRGFRSYDLIAGIRLLHPPLLGCLQTDIFWPRPVYKQPRLARNRFSILAFEPTPLTPGSTRHCHQNSSLNHRISLDPKSPQHPPTIETLHAACFVQGCFDPSEALSAHAELSSSWAGGGLFEAFGLRAPRINFAVKQAIGV